LAAQRIAFDLFGVLCGKRSFSGKAAEDQNAGCVVEDWRKPGQWYVERSGHDVALRRPGKSAPVVREDVIFFFKKFA
jgi:hypothetical protein